MLHNMENKVEISNLGKPISEAILVDGYSLTLRCDKIRHQINEKLKELELNDVQVQVIVDKLDKLQLSIWSDNLESQATIPITEGIDDEEVVSDGKKTNKERFIDTINSLINNYQLKMKQSKKTATVVVRDERESIAQNLAKAIRLSTSEVILSLEKCGVFNLAEACSKMTNGAINNVVVEGGVYTFISNNGFSLTFNSAGHSEAEVDSAITCCIMNMMDLGRIVKPLVAVSEVPVSNDDTPIRAIDSTKEQKAAYNREIKKALDAIGTELDNLEKRAFSQRVRGIFLKCANRAHYSSLSTASIPLHIGHMSPDNKERVRNLYYIYNQTMPEWQEGESVNKARKFQTMRVKVDKG